MQLDYTDPVARLLNYGGYDLRRIKELWPDYLKLGFSEKHVPELIRMTMDDDLNNASQDDLKVWPPLHAWRTLGQLRAVEAAKPLVRLFDNLEHDAWLSTDLREVFSLIGPASIPAIAEFIGDNEVDEICRIAAPACLEKIARDHPEHRAECIGTLKLQLAFYETNGLTLNAFLIESLADLRATETIDVIRKAFFADCVDLVVLGDFEDVEIIMGLRVGRDTARPDVQLIPGLPDLDGDNDWDMGSADISADLVTNQFRHVGRNDPCPCGSGKKYK